MVAVSDWFVAASLKTGRLQRLLPNWQQDVDIWAISAQRSAQSVKVKLLLECLRDQIPPHQRITTATESVL